VTRGLLARALLTATALAVLSPCPRQYTAAQSPPHQHQHEHKASEENGGDKSAGQKEETLKVSFPDLEVSNQRGEKVRLYSDLIKGKVVVVSFFFTSCTYVCPIQGAALSRLRESLGDRLGRDVHFVSISTDPETDTPLRLREWGERFHVGRGWTLVTGEKEEMNSMLAKFTGDVAGARDGHAINVYVGDDKSGRWVVGSGLMGVAEYLAHIEKVTHDDGAIHKGH